MWSSVLLIGITVSIALLCAAHTTKTCEISPRGDPYFPKNFSFGVATSAYQIEGGWNADGKGPSNWDEFVHNHPEFITDGSNGDIAADSYHRFDQDLEAMKELKVSHYRFSISWPRIFPNGDISSRNQKGIDYYNDVIDKLLANGIKPMVTMFHYDLPLEIEKLGGFVNSLFIEKFVEYATELFKTFGDRVKTWITFNEAHIFCKSSYADGKYPPQMNAHGVGDYICIENTLKAHAATYRAYRSLFYKKQKGKIGLALDSFFNFPKGANETEAALRGIEFNLGILSNPIFHKSGGYPEIVIEEIKSNSLKEGRSKPRLSQFDEYWKNMIKGSADFFALNYYTARLTKRAVKPVGLNPSFERDLDCEESTDPTWFKGKKWLYCVPEGLESMLKFIRDQYDNIEVIITENGWSDDGEINDDNRIRYLKSHLQAILNALHDGSNITGYTYWSLMDNFEWTSGYSSKFGLYAVDMLSPKKERIPKKSADYYKQVIKYRKILNNLSNYKQVMQHNAFN